MEGEEAFSPIVAQIAQVQRVERVQMQACRLLKRKSPRNELRSEAMMSQEDKRTPTKLELKSTNRLNLKEPGGSTSPKQDSPKSDKGGSPRSAREIVSPLFSPIMAGHRFSPLSPEQREWAGQQ